MIAGRVTDILTGNGIGGATLSIPGVSPVTTAGDGAWQVELPPPAGNRVQATVAMPGFLTRETYVAWSTTGRQDVAIDLLPERSPFSLDFYRQMARNALEGDALEPLRRWTADPKFYINTHNPRTGFPLKPSEVEALVQNVRDAVSQVTGGVLNAAEIETGAFPRQPRFGYINIEIVYEPEGEFCGEAFVGANPGEITLNYERCASSCGGLALGPELVAHEVGHALGFWHVGEGVMQAGEFMNCPTVNFTERERLHGNVAYRRPSGNLDVDKDPAGFAALTGPGAAPFIRCGRKRP